MSWSDSDDVITLENLEAESNTGGKASVQSSGFNLANSAIGGTFCYITFRDRPTNLYINVLISWSFSFSFCFLSNRYFTWFFDHGCSSDFICCDNRVDWICLEAVY